MFTDCHFGAIQAFEDLDVESAHKKAENDLLKAYLKLQEWDIDKNGPLQSFLDVLSGFFF